MFKSNLKSSKTVFKLFKQNVNSFCRSTEDVEQKQGADSGTLPATVTSGVIKTEVILFIQDMITGYLEKTVTLSLQR